MLMAKGTGIALAMNPAAKAEVCVTAEFPWEDFYVEACTVLEDEGVYKMWYDASCWTGASSPTNPGRYQCYTTSRDGIHWEKPMLGIADFQGSTKNNIVLPNTLGTVFIDPNATDGNRFKFAGWWHGKATGLWIFASSDGLHWKPYLDEPVLSKGQFDTQNQAFWDTRINKYVAYIRRWVGPLRYIGRSETADLHHWPEAEIVFGPDDRDPNESDFYTLQSCNIPMPPMHT